MNPRKTVPNAAARRLARQPAKPPIPPSKSATQLWRQPSPAAAAVAPKPRATVLSKPKAAPPKRAAAPPKPAAIPQPPVRPKLQKRVAPDPADDIDDKDFAELETYNARPWYIALLVVGLALLGASAFFAWHATAMPHWELRAFELINGMHAPSWLANQVAKPLSNAVWGMAGLAALLLVVPKFRLRAWQYVVAVGSSLVVAVAIEHFVKRPRPAGLTHQIVARASEGGYGFPSDHTTTIAALGLAVWPYVSWLWRILIIILVGAVAWSRIFLGLHALLDIVSGCAVAAATVAIIHLVPEKIRKFFRLDV